MAAICLAFAIHEPYFLRRYTIFDVKEDSIYEDDDRSCNHLIHLAKNCYLPMLELLYKLFKRYEDKFKIAFTVSSTAIDLFEQYTPEVLASLKTLAKTGCVEFITETAPHSLAFLYSKSEFIRQIKNQNQRLETVFGQKPTTFRHTELLFCNDLAKDLDELGLHTVLAEGSRQVLGWRNTNYVYNSFAAPNVNILLRNGRLSGDLSSRFNQRDWDQWPLTAEKFATWCSSLKSADCINIFGDFHLFGLRNPKESGIFEFMEALPQAVLERQGLSFMTPKEIVTNYQAKDSLDIPKYISWRDEGCDIQGWLGNEMQKDAITQLYQLTDRVRKIADSELQYTFERLQTSDYFHYMSTRWFSESQPDRPTPFSSPYDAYISYMNILEDFKGRLETAEENARKGGVSEASLTSQKSAESKASSEPAKVQTGNESGPQPQPQVFFKTFRRRNRVKINAVDNSGRSAREQTEEMGEETKNRPIAYKIAKSNKTSKKITQAKNKPSARSKKKS